MKAPLVALSIVVLMVSACERENRRFRDVPAAGQPSSYAVLSDVQAGTGTVDLDLSPNAERNAYAISEGKKLYEYFNCVGCHAHGGGGMGPPLMDDEWIYGEEPENIYDTIVEGRPNGMPSFRGKIPADRIWWIAAYVRSMSGLTPKGARPNRDDDMQYKKPEMRRKGAEKPRSGSNTIP